MKCALQCADIETLQNHCYCYLLHCRGRVPVYSREAKAIHRGEDEDGALPLV